MSTGLQLKAFLVLPADRKKRGSSILTKGGIAVVTDDAPVGSGCDTPAQPRKRTMGRPSIDPDLMIRMLIEGYVFAIRSERSHCREVRRKPRLSSRARLWF
ncbi:transposase [Bradyrhizobium sp. F1.4.3]